MAFRYRLLASLVAPHLFLRAALFRGADIFRPSQKQRLRQSRGEAAVRAERHRCGGASSPRENHKRGKKKSAFLVFIVLFGWSWWRASGFIFIGDGAIQSRGKMGGSGRSTHAVAILVPLAVELDEEDRTHVHTVWWVDCFSLSFFTNV